MRRPSFQLTLLAFAGLIGAICDCAASLVTFHSFTSSQLDPIVLKSQHAEGGGLVSTEEGSESSANSLSSSHGQEEPDSMDAALHANANADAELCAEFHTYVHPDK